MNIPLAAIRTDGGTQSRAELNQIVIADYAEAVINGAQFPPIIMFYDGSDYWLADGFHRVQAAHQAGLESINADVRQGTLRDAVLYSVGANAAHGLRRTNADKRRAVTHLLTDAEWSQWSDREIARRCGVSNNFVSELRRSLSSDDSDTRIYTTKHGTVATMQTANIGQNEPLTADEQQALREAEATIASAFSSLAHVAACMRDVQLRMTGLQFEQWAQAEFGMDARTAHDLAGWHPSEPLTSRILDYMTPIEEHPA